MYITLINVDSTISFPEVLRKLDNNKYINIKLS